MPYENEKPRPRAGGRGFRHFRKRRYKNEKDFFLYVFLHFIYSQTVPEYIIYR
jgi:hypothetical protein